MLGVAVHVRSCIERLPAGPTIVAAGPRAAAALLGRPDLAGDGQEVALLDLGLAPGGPAGSGPASVLDLDEGVCVVRATAIDPSLAPPEHHLLQCAAGIRPGEPATAAVTRIDGVVKGLYPAARSRIVMRHASVVASPGRRDPVGEDWHDPEVPVARNRVRSSGSDGPRTRRADGRVACEVPDNAGERAGTAFRASVRPASVARPLPRPRV